MEMVTMIMMLTMMTANRDNVNDTDENDNDDDNNDEDGYPDYKMTHVEGNLIGTLQTCSDYSFLH